MVDGAVLEKREWQYYLVPLATARAPGPAGTPSAGLGRANLIRSLSNVAPVRSVRACASSGVVLCATARS